MLDVQFTVEFHSLVTGATEIGKGECVLVPVLE